MQSKSLVRVLPFPYVSIDTSVSRAGFVPSDLQTANLSRFPNLMNDVHGNAVGELSTGGQHCAYLLHRELRIRAALMQIKYTFPR
jgi:hypothetical protein